MSPEVEAIKQASSNHRVTFISTVLVVVGFLTVFVINPSLFGKAVNQSYAWSAKHLIVLASILGS